MKSRLRSAGSRWALLVGILMFGSCSSNSGIVPMGGDRFMVSRQAATGFSGSGTLMADALREAAGYCGGLNRSTNVISTWEAPPPYLLGNFPKAEIVFTCVDPSASEGTTPPSWAGDPADKPSVPSELDPFIAAVVTVQTSGGTGSGFRVTSDGLYLTNEHVVGNARAVSLVFHNGSVSRASVLRVDQARDLALLKGPAGTPHLVLGGTPAVGTDVWAIGAPTDFPFSVSKGIVSAIRPVAYPVGQRWTYIQTDAAINIGNSGGPLISIDDGTVVGVNTWGIRNAFVTSGGVEGTEGLSFAIPADTARTFMESR